MWAIYGVCDKSAEQKFVKLNRGLRPVARIGLPRPNLPGQVGEGTSIKGAWQ